MDKIESLTLLYLQQQDLSKCAVEELIEKYNVAEKEIKIALAKLSKSQWSTSSIRL